MYPKSPHLNESGLRAEWYTPKAHIYGPDGRIISSVGNRFGKSRPGLQLQGDGLAWIRCMQYSNVLTNAGDAGSFDFLWQHNTDSVYLYGTPASAPFSYGHLAPQAGAFQLRMYRRSFQSTGGFDGQHFFPGLYDFSYPRLLGVSTLLVDEVTKECEITLYLDGVLIDGFVAFGQTNVPVVVSCTTLLAYGTGSNAADGFIHDYRDYNCDYKYIAGRNHLPTGRETRWFTFEGTSTTTVWDVSGNGNHAEIMNANASTIRAVNPNATYSLLNEFGYTDSGEIIPAVIPFNNTAADGSPLEHKGAVRHELQMVDSYCLSLDGVAYVKLPNSVNHVINDSLSLWFQTDGSASTGFMFHTGSANCLERFFFSAGKLVVYPFNGHADLLEGSTFGSAGCQAATAVGSDGGWHEMTIKREMYTGEEAFRYYLDDQPIGLTIKAVGNNPGVRFIGVRNTEVSDFFTGKLAGLVVDGKPMIPFADGPGSAVEAFDHDGTKVTGTIHNGSGTEFDLQDHYHYNATRNAHLSKAFPSTTETKLAFPDCPLVRSAGIDPAVHYSASDLAALSLGKFFLQEKNGTI